MRRLISAVLLVALCPIAAASENKGYLTYGQGNKSCGEYLDIRKGNEKISELLVTAWIGGYLTRVSMDHRIDTIETDLPSMRQWIENYCRENPLQNIAQATNRLTLHLHAAELVTYLPP